MRAFNNQSGTGLIEILLAAGLIGFIALGIAQLFVNSADQQSRMNTLYQLDQTRRNLTILLSNDSHWSATLSGNSGLSCLSRTQGALKPDCAHDASIPFTIFTNGGVSFFNPAVQGFSKTGVICNQSDPECVYLLNLQVKTLCAPVGIPATMPISCQTPSEVLITGLFAPIQGRQIASAGFNSSNYAVSIRKEAALAAAAGNTSALELTCGAASMVSGPPYVCPTGTAALCSPAACPSGYVELASPSNTLSSFSVYNYGASYAGCTYTRHCIPSN